MHAHFQLFEKSCIGSYMADRFLQYLGKKLFFKFDK